MESRFWIKIFFIIIIELGNLDLKLITYYICGLKKNLVFEKKTQNNKSQTLSMYPRRLYLYYVYYFSKF